MGWFSSKPSRPTAREVAERAIVLKYVATFPLVNPPRDDMKALMARWSEADREKFRAYSERSRDEYWARLGGLRKKMSPKEVDFSKATAVTMTDRQMINASWRLEALVVLMWASKQAERLPEYDSETSPDIIKGFPPDEIEAFVRGAVLRDAAEMDAARDAAELWHWRSRTRQLIESGEPFKPIQGMKFRSYDEIVRFTAPMAHGDGTIPAVVDEDFMVYGKAYRDMTDEEWSTVRSITMERHFALNWLCGKAPGNRWDETPTDT